MDTLNINQLAVKSKMSSRLLQAVLLLIVLALFVWFIFIPRWNSYQQINQQLALLSNQEAQLQSEQAELNRLVSVMRQSTQEVALLDEALPLSSRPTKIAMLIEAYAQNSAMLLSGLNISEPDKFIAAGNKAVLADPFSSNRSLATIDVSLTVAGNTEQFKNFLQLLEQSGRIIDVESFTVTRPETGINNNYSLKLKTYAYELETTKN